MERSHRGVAIVAAAWMLLTLGTWSNADDEKPRIEAGSLHESFESPQVAWEREHTDTTINLIAQERSVRAAHDGSQSERFQFEAEPGSQFFVSYALPKVPVTETLQASLYVRGSRAGVQLFARVVLPADVDPETKAPSFVLVPGTIYDRIDRWQRLELSNLLPSIERQARVLRVSSRRAVSLEGAYLDRVVVNLLGSPGASEVFLDDLSVSPVPGEILADLSKPGAEKAEEKGGGAPGRGGSGASAAGPLVVRLDRNRLRRRDKEGRYHDFLPTAIDAPGADVVELRRYGFDLLVDDRRSDPGRINTALEKGFLLLPKLSGISPKTDVDQTLREIQEYPHKDAAALWDLGEGLGRMRDPKRRDEELALTRKVVSAIRQLPADFSTITTGMVDGELPLYSRAPGNLDTIGIQPLLWASAQSYEEGLEFLRQRRRLTARSNLGGLFWAWIPVVAPPIVRTNIWGDEVPPAWGVPQIQPEQIRLMTYMALAAGYRGLGYLGDADLTRPAGRAQLIEMAFLNEEIDLCESILARSADPIPTYYVFDPDPPNLPPPGAMPGTRIRPQKEFNPKPNLQAAGISVGRGGALLLLANYANDAQYQPPQMAAHNLVIRAMLPESAQAFEISPGEIKLLERERVPGGTQLILPDFATTAMILCTTDIGLKDRMETYVAQVRPVAVQLAIEQAEIMLQNASEINGRLSADGQTLVTKEELRRRYEAGIMTRPVDERALLTDAEGRIKAAREARERFDYPVAWSEARRALRALRILMHGHWTKTFQTFAKAASDSWPKPPKGSKIRPIPVLVQPVSCPPCVTFNTLPEAYVWTDWIGGKLGYRFGENRVPSGSFDDAKAMAEDGWANFDYQMDGVTVKKEVAAREKGSDDLVIRMSVESANPRDLDKNVPFFDFPMAALRSPAIKVQANNLIRISVQVKRPIASVPGMGGIIVRDSIGGEQLQFRTPAPIPSFSRIVLYRKAPADGELTVTLGLAGYGEAYFDDFRIELVEADAAPTGSDIAAAPDDRRAAAPPLPEPSEPSDERPSTPRRVRRR
jgi:hypothetical protein